MADDKTARDQKDRSRVAGDQNYELAYLEERLGVSREAVKSAIQAVGNDRVNVEEYLKNHKGR